MKKFSLYETLIENIPINKNTYLDRWRLYNSAKVSKAEVCRKLGMTELQVYEICSSEFKEIIKKYKSDD